MKRFDSIVFTYDGRERSGQFLSEEPSCGVAVSGWADGRNYWVGHQDIRPETAREREQREKFGYFVEDVACSAG